MPRGEQSSFPGLNTERAAESCNLKQTGRQQTRELSAARVYALPIRFLRLKLYEMEAKLCCRYLSTQILYFYPWCLDVL